MTGSSAGSPSDGVTLDLRQIEMSRGALQLGPLSFTVASSSRVWLSGPNGSGKSTLLHIIAGLTSPDRGSVSIAGADVTTTPPWERRCALLLQGLGLWPQMSIRRQCLIAADSTTADDRLRELAGDLGVEAFLDRLPGELSGGEAQRCALVRTLMKPAEVVLLDEPFAAQHESGIEQITRVLDRLRDEERAVIVAGHRAVADADRLSL